MTQRHLCVICSITITIYALKPNWLIIIGNGRLNCYMRHLVTFTKTLTKQNCFAYVRLDGADNMNPALPTSATPIDYSFQIRLHICLLSAKSILMNKTFGLLNLILIRNYI